MATIDLPRLAGVSNQSVANQVINAATTALLTGSLLPIPLTRLRIGTIFRFSLSVSKTAAGTAANIFHVRIGTLGTVSDPIILTFTLPVGTAAIDLANIEILVTVQGPLTSLCILRGRLNLSHDLAITGFSTKANVVLTALSSGFNMAVDNLFVSVSCTTAASTVLTFHQIISEGWNL